MSGTSGTSRVAVIDRVHQALASLGLSELDGVVEARLEQAAQQEQAYGEFLADLLECEVRARRERYLRTRLRLAHLPAVKTLAQFDFGFQPSIDERQKKKRGRPRVWENAAAKHRSHRLRKAALAQAVGALIHAVLNARLEDAELQRQVNAATDDLAVVEALTEYYRDRHWQWPRRRAE